MKNELLKLKVELYKILEEERYDQEKAIEISRKIDNMILNDYFNLNKERKLI